MAKTNSLLFIGVSSRKYSTFWSSFWASTVLKDTIMKTLITISILVAFYATAQATKTTDTDKTVLTAAKSVILSSN